MIYDKIKKQALELSSEEQAELAHMLIDSLNPEKEFESEEAWSEELKKLSFATSLISTSNSIKSSPTPKVRGLSWL